MNSFFSIFLLLAHRLSFADYRPGSGISVLNNILSIYLGFLGGSVVKNLPTMQELQVRSLGWEDPLEKVTAKRVQYS